MIKKHEESVTYRRSPCPIASTLDIIGDKWSLLVVRDLFAGKKTYSDFQGSPEHIPTNILADRLKRLVAYEIVLKRPYQKKPVRYEYILTAKGKGLGAILKAMVLWGETHLPGTKANIVSPKKI
jgi:DNA-binding HxlR family transcriptional regulator